MTADILPRPSREAAVKLLEGASLPASDLTDAHMEHFFFQGPREAPTGRLYGPTVR